MAYVFPERFGGVDCLQGVDPTSIEEMFAHPEMEEAQALSTDWGIPDWFEREVTTALANLHVGEVTLHNIWLVFSALEARLSHLDFDDST